MSRTALAPPRVTPIKERTYPHFDLRLTAEERAQFSISPEKVTRHDFFPFIGFDQRRRDIDFDNEPHWKIRSKSRPIRYAAHFDAAIHSHYCAELQTSYEKRLAELHLGNTALAYRSGIGSNIKFAKDLFDEIKIRKDCVVFCYDIKGFFDNLNHSTLERSLVEIFGVQKLSKDWVKVFKRLTRYEWVEYSDIKRWVPASDQGGRVCSAEQFRRLIRTHIRKNQTDFGIPQGSPLSGTLANAYMLAFDQRMNLLLTKLGGSYRTYSDDIAIVLPDVANKDLLEITMNVILMDIFLSVNPKKTTETHFFPTPDGLGSRGTLLQYLGFTFDGHRVLIRSSSLSSFYSRMKIAIRIAVRAAHHAGYPEGEIRRRSLVGRFTHLGDDRNFVQYCFRAARAFSSDDIRRQLRNHFQIFRDAFSQNILRYYHGKKGVFEVSSPRRALSGG